MDYIRDPSWEFLGTIIGALIVILIYRLQRTRKSLEYEVLSDTPLLSGDEKLEGDFKLLFKGEPVENLDLALVKYLIR